MAKRGNLSEKQIRAVRRAAYGEVIKLLDPYAYGEPFKHRQLPEMPEALEEAADDYFFVCIGEIAKELAARQKEQA